MSYPYGLSSLLFDPWWLPLGNNFQKLKNKLPREKNIVAFNDILQVTMERTIFSLNVFFAKNAKSININ